MCELLLFYWRFYLYVPKNSARSPLGEVCWACRIGRWYELCSSSCLLDLDFHRTYCANICDLDRHRLSLPRITQLWESSPRHSCLWVDMLELWVGWRSIQRVPYFQLFNTYFPCNAFALIFIVIDSYYYLNINYEYKIGMNTNSLIIKPEMSFGK